MTDSDKRLETGDQTEQVLHPEAQTRTGTYILRTRTVHWRSEPQGFGEGQGRVCQGKRPPAVSLNIRDPKRWIVQAGLLHVTDITEEISSFASRDQ